MRLEQGRLGLVLGLCALGVVSASAAQVPARVDRLLTVADVERILGTNGLVVIPRGSTPDANSALNIGRASDKYIILRVDLYAGMDLDNLRELMTEPERVNGVGDDAVAPESWMFLAFRKGTLVVQLTNSFTIPIGDLFMNRQQLIALGKLIASRL